MKLQVLHASWWYSPTQPGVCVLEEDPCVSVELQHLLPVELVVGESALLQVLDDDGAHTQRLRHALHLLGATQLGCYDNM